MPLAPHEVPPLVETADPRIVQEFLNTIDYALRDRNFTEYTSISTSIRTVTVRIHPTTTLSLKTTEVVLKEVCDQYKEAGWFDATYMYEPDPRRVMTTAIIVNLVQNLD